MSRLSVDMQKIPVMRILIPFVSGIIAAEQSDFLVSIMIFLIVLAALIMACRICIPTRPGFAKIFVSLFFFLAGLLTSHLSGMKERQMPEFDDAERVVAYGKVISAPVLINGTYKFDIESSYTCSASNSFAGRTGLIGNIDNGDYSDMNDPRKQYLFTGNIYRIRNNGNPGEFDYAGYMAGRNFYYRLYIDSIITRDTQASFLPGIKDAALLLKNRITSGWYGHDDEMGILMAIVLGDKSELNPEIRADYSEAGAMHVLAVSGLHIGLIWLILQKLLFFISVLPGGKRIRSFIVILILWFYAFMAGLSPSVCRSVSMFSLLSLSSLLGRKSSSLNILLLSALLLLVIDPHQLKEVGFQLSYLAVFGILAIQPMLSGWISSKYRIIRWILDMSYVSLAAQVATIPVSIFYFHQVPVYSLLTNLLAIPLLSCMVAMFIISIPFFILQFMDHTLFMLLIKMAGLMNRMMEIISGLPGSTIRGLSPNGPEVMLIMIMIASGLLFLRYRNIIFILSLVLAFSGSVVTKSIARFGMHGRRTCIVAHFRKGTLVTLAEGLQINHFISSGDSVTLQIIDKYLQQAWPARNLRQSYFFIDSITGAATQISAIQKLFNNCWLLGNQQMRILFITGYPDPNHSGFFKEYPAHVIVLNNLEFPGQIDEIKFYPGAILILDGSNPPWIVAGISESVQSMYLTDKKGAYVKSY